MAQLDPLQVNEELKKANEAHVSAVVANLTAVFQVKTTLELQKSAVAARSVDGKAPSEAACDRQARCTPEYIKACKDEIQSVKQQQDCHTSVEYLRYKLQIAIALIEKK